MGAYRYDERRNNKPVYFDNQMLLPADRLRFIALLSCPYNENSVFIKMGNNETFYCF